MTDMTLNFSLFEDKSKNESYSTEADGIGLGPLLKYFDNFYFALWNRKKLKEKKVTILKCALGSQFELNIFEADSIHSKRPNLIYQSNYETCVKIGVLRIKKSSRML